MRVVTLYLRRLLALLAAVAVVGCSEAEPYKLGYIAGLSGRVADLGIAGRNGAMLAIEQRNAAGGVDGRKVVLEVRDDAQRAETAVQGATELVEAGVEAIIGPMTSVMAMELVPVINQHGVVMVSPTVTTSQLTGIDDNFLRVIRDTDEYGRRNAEYRFQQLGHRRIAVVYDVRNASYTESWLASFRKYFERQGGEVIKEVTFRSGEEVHFSELAQQLVDAQPDSVQIVSAAMDAALLIHQLRKLAPAMPIATSEWAATEKLLELGGTAVEGVVMAQFFDRSSSTPSYLQFRQAYEERFSQPPGFAEIAGYDAAQVIMTALAEKRDGESLKEAIVRIGAFKGAQGTVVIDRYGDAQRDTYITEVKNGQFRLVE
ncbi:ABC transporter substrate-binding protein [Motiliproteus sediminis]|uniref:ABC transporter substrate-binding protein n=1 Tax=Motiliproteus sediminis TaxID=1468178 RepID=UPI001AEF6EE2|nr:ABC transporter substrate-binding protein [Motiliproteus sediminis]